MNDASNLPDTTNPPDTSQRAPWWPFLLILALALTADLLTKSMALEHLAVGRTQYPLGDWLPLTLHFNTGGLWGLGGGWVSRWVFAPITLLALWVVGHLYRDTLRDQWLRRATLPLIAAGALGNLVDRLRREKGVVDFLGPFDLGFMIWPIFNVADMAISVSTFLLVWALWREARSEAAEEARSGAEPLANS